MDELELIRRAGQGDESAFEQLVIAYEKPVYNLCLRMCGDRDEAFDLSQDTFIKAWHAISMFQGDSKFQTWLMRIASNTCIDHLRKKKRKNVIPMTDLDREDEPLERQIADYETDPAVLAEKAQDHEAVREAMSRLPDQDRLILSMRAIEDMSYREIGEALELQPGTVKSRISRAREKIRRSLDGNLFDFSSSKKGKGGMRS